MTSLMNDTGFATQPLPRHIEAWSRAYVASGLADAVWVRNRNDPFQGRIRRRSLRDLMFVEVEADPFSTRWNTDSPTTGYVGVAVNTRDFAERVVFGDSQEVVTRSPIDIWDASTLIESEVLGPMSQTVVLVPKAALHMSRTSPLLLRDALEDYDQALLRLLRSVVLAVADDVDRFGTAAADAARNSVVDLLLSVVQERRQSLGGVVSDGMRLAVIRWVDENLAFGQLSPRGAAEEHGISVRSLHRLFRDSGDSFGSFVRRRRLERACRDLLQADDMVQTIAMRWGYADASQFINEFKRAFGSTPAAYRKAHRSGV
jgi:AraC family transcriptional activator of tynA and feaB